MFVLWQDKIDVNVHAYSIWYIENKQTISKIQSSSLEFEN